MTEPVEAPRLWTRLAARLQGEVPADQLEAGNSVDAGTYLEVLRTGTVVRRHLLSDEV